MGAAAAAASAFSTCMLHLISYLLVLDPNAKGSSSHSVCMRTLEPSASRARSVAESVRLLFAY